MVIGPLQFEEPAWLILAPILWAVVLIVGRRSLSGLGATTRWAAQGIRLIVLTLGVMALAQPSYRLPGEGLSVFVLNDLSASMPDDARAEVVRYVGEAISDAEPEDRMGYISLAREGKPHKLPSRGVRPRNVFDEFIGPALIDPGPRDATNLAQGVFTALASAPEDTANRILIISDGNETVGSLITAAEAAKSRGIPIDVLPIPYEIDAEVMFDKLIAPATARKGQSVKLRFLVVSTGEGEVDLALEAEGRIFDLTPGEPGSSRRVSVKEGPNPFEVDVTMNAGGPQRFKASVNPVTPGIDSRIENNEAMAVTFVRTQGVVLVYTVDPTRTRPLLDALADSEIEVEVVHPVEGPKTLEALQGYDAIVLDNVGAYEFSGAHQQDLAAYVHDAGGGLIMVGGDRSFGAGGWIGTPVADVLPVKLDPPQKRQMPRGALALIMHSCEMPQGNFWGQKVADAAVDALGSQDLVGIIEYAWTSGFARWVYDLQPKGDGVAAAQAIKNLNFGDMPDFSPSMTAVHKSLKAANAGAKHCVIISDGDPAPPSQQLIQGYINAGISITTVCVFPHGGVGDRQMMANLATATGGNSYFINNAQQLAQLPQIFIKEAQMVKRELIWEGDPIAPHGINPAAEPMRGMRALPEVTGYVVAADREGLSLITARIGEEDDPVLAQWQYGLGRSVAFLSDAGARWASSWPSWGSYKSFWEQHVRWAMRPSGSANVSLLTQTVGDRTRIIITALDSAGEPLNFARFATRIVGPDGKAVDVETTQTGPGRYEGEFSSPDPGSYLVSSIYEAAKDGQTEKGSVQASVSVPFAEEHRALEDNSALLERAAEMTGGRVLDPDPTRAELFSRADLAEPVALTPLWLRFTLWSMALFLLDVAVRRVRIDLIAIARSIRGVFDKSKQASTSQVDAMRAARERAKSRTVQRSAEASKTAKKKFEADPAAAASAPEGPLDAQRKAPLIDTRKKEPEQAPAEEEGMSRLLKAKRRAQEGHDDKDKPPGTGRL